MNGLWRRLIFWNDVDHRTDIHRKALLQASQTFQREVRSKYSLRQYEVMLQNRPMKWRSRARHQCLQDLARIQEDQRRIHERPHHPEELLLLHEEEMAQYDLWTSIDLYSWWFYNARRRHWKRRRRDLQAGYSRPRPMRSARHVAIDG